MKLSCVHKPQLRLEFFCHTGNYVIELCKKCRKTESDEFLIREEIILISNAEQYSQLKQKISLRNQNTLHTTMAGIT